MNPRSPVIFAIGSLSVVAGALWIVQVPIDISPILLADQNDRLATPEHRKIALSPTEKSFPSPSEIVSRPLFSPDRRKFEPPPPKQQRQSLEQGTPKRTPPQQSVKVPISEMPEFKLHGVSIAHDRSRILLALNGESPAWIQLGDFIGDWRVAHIDANGVIMSSNDNELRLNLYREER